MSSNTIYCTYVTIYSGNRLPPFYLGSSSIDKIQMGYRGSVSSKRYKEIWKKELLLNSHLFKTKIISTHFSREEALIKEASLQSSLNVVQNPLYVNMSIAGGKFGMMTIDNDTRLKMSKASKGKPKSLEHRLRIAEANRIKAKNPEFRKKLSFKRTAEQRRKMSESGKGKIKSKEHCEAISKALTGKKRGQCSDERRLAIIAALKGKAQRILECPHCKKQGGYAAILRWHFDNCKFKQ